MPLNGDDEDMILTRGFAGDVSGGLASELEGGKRCCGTKDQLGERIMVFG